LSAVPLFHEFVGFERGALLTLEIDVKPEFMGIPLFHEFAGFARGSFLSLES
jgi:hypothetical protein